MEMPKKIETKANTKPLEDFVVEATGGLDWRHYNQGGTFITNFSAERMPVMKEAARIYGDPHIRILDIVKPPAPRGYGGCLHYTGVMDGHGLSGFWRIFYDIYAINALSVNPSAEE